MLEVEITFVALTTLIITVLTLFILYSTRKRSTEELEIVEGPIDDRDEMILKVLSSYGALSVSEISRITGLYKSTVWRRVQKLRDLGLVKIKVVSGKTIIERYSENYEQH